MSGVWLTQAGMQGDGEFSVAGPRGAVKIPVVDGVFLWPEELGKPHSSFVAASPTPRARAASTAAERASLESERAALEARLRRLQEPEGERSAAQGAAVAADAPAVPAVPVVPTRQRSTRGTSAKRAKR